MSKIIFVGRLIEEKGCHVLLEAINKLKEDDLSCHLYICGDGPFRSDLEKYVKRNDLKNHVTFYGNVHSDPLITLYQKSDVAVIPSLIDEPFGLTAIEAMSCGLPVIGSSVGGLKYIIKEAGFDFRRGDSQELSEKLRILLLDSNLRKKMAVRSRQIALEKYDQKRMAEEYKILFKRLIN